MFERQKQDLNEAKLLHQTALHNKHIARQRVQQKRQDFLAEPLNLLYPYAAGILICASELKSDTKGLNRIPFMNLAKTGVGIWTLITRVRKIKENRAKAADLLTTRESQSAN